MKAVTVTINKGDLKGEYANILDCPIARALKRAFPEYPRLTVGSTMFWLKDRYIVFASISPRLQEASDEIWQRKARPFWFNVSVPK